MDKLLFFLAAVGFAGAIFIEESSNRITNGNVASDTQFPYVVSIQQIAALPNQVQAHRCGGALITLQAVVTAGACGYYIANGSMVPIVPAQYRVYAGGALLTGDNLPERVRNIANITVHPDHLIAPSLINDIAVIMLVSPFLNSTVVPIPLATNNFVPNDFTLCSLAGWGAQTALVTASNELRYTTKYTYNHQLCTIIYNSIAGYPNIHPSMICAVSYDLYSAGCTGDVGNALICGGELTGILSVTNQCLMTTYPEVYTRVSNYTTWIRSISGASTFKPELGLFAIAAIVCLKMFS